MLLATVSTLSSEDSTYNKEHIRALRGILSEQQGDLVQLRTIIDNICSCKCVSLDHSDVEKYTAELLQVEDYQHHRFNKIDEMIYHNRKEIKKAKTTDHTVETYGKEVRKLEAGLRTLRLFVGDVIDMLSPNSAVINRVDDRIAYFEKRSTTLIAEMNELMEKMLLL